MNLNDIAEVYAAYPRHKDRGAAFKAIDKALRRLEGGENGRKLMYCDAVLFLLAAVQEFANSPAGQKGEFTPYPATFFNRSAYLDDRAEWGKVPTHDDSLPTLTPEEETWMDDWQAKERARIGGKR